MRSIALFVGVGVLLASASQASSDSVKSLNAALSYPASSGSKAKASIHGSSGSKNLTRSGQKLLQSRRGDWRRLIKFGAKKNGSPGCWVVLHQPTPATEGPVLDPNEEDPDPTETTWIPDAADEPLLLSGPNTESRVAAVPILPALPLFAGGLGLTGWLARRRRG